MRNAQHASPSIHRQWGATVVVLAAAGMAACECQSRAISLTPALSAHPPALYFSACPARDQNDRPVEGVAPDRQIVTLQNIGKTTATLSYALRGSGARQFAIAPETRVDSLASGGSAEVAVFFTPIQRGDVTAELVIDDGAQATEPLVVPLIGTGSALPAQPTIEVLYEQPDTATFTACMPSISGAVENCFMQWPSTFYGESRTLKLVVKNVGCGPMNVTELKLEPYAVPGQLQYFLDAPQILPSPLTPITLPNAAAVELSVRFAPAADASAQSDSRFALLTIGTNAANGPASWVVLQGEALVPSCYLTPSRCDFTSPEDTCGGTKTPAGGNPTAAFFHITNGGNAPVLIESVSFRDPNNGRFALGSRNPVGKILARAQSEVLDVTYADAPLYVIETLDVRCRAGTANAGNPSATVAGGVLPCLSTTPDLQLDFSGAATQVSTQPVQICNGAGCGVLDIRRVEIVQNLGGTFFTIVPATNPTGQKVQPGACTSVEVQLSRPVSGGLQTATLEVESNDPNFAAPSYKRINLLSSAPLDQIPVAVVKGPAGEAFAVSVSLARLSTKRITLHGEESYDPPNNDPATRFQWFISEKPITATASLTETSTLGTGPNVHASVLERAAGGDKIDLNIDPAVPGEYGVALRVYDSAGQASGNVAELRILVNP